LERRVKEGHQTDENMKILNRCTAATELRDKHRHHCTRCFVITALMFAKENPSMARKLNNNSGCQCSVIEKEKQ